MPSALKRRLAKLKANALYFYCQTMAVIIRKFLKQNSEPILLVKNLLRLKDLASLSAIFLYQNTMQIWLAKNNSSKTYTPYGGTKLVATGWIAPIMTLTTLCRLIKRIGVLTITVTIHSSTAILFAKMKVTAKKLTDAWIITANR